MGISLFDKETEDICFSINFWHWRAIVEEIRRLNLFSDALVDSLHEAYCNNGLSKEECSLVAQTLRAQVIPKLSETERILLNGERTEEPDDGEFHREQIEKNYSTNKAVLLKFVECLESCNGFEIF
ncbi:hypothetical protein [Hahella ganghwensis]|uniref:hypothetical protein n=1 Tax=Hahella ganghwensis TaxID=286420 RepID=UPI00035DEE73|nr:hypothetical protein [Hahella ganghwensis]